LKQKNRKAKAKATKNQKLSTYSFLFCFPCEQLKFSGKPAVLAAKHSPSFPSVCMAADATYARKIAAHMCHRRQRYVSPRRLDGHVGGRLAAQHTPLVA
jgi:hypothetical protein